LKLAEIFLGILTAVGGFVDVSELVFMSQAGSRFGYALIWVVVLSTIGIMVFGEMSGRVAAIAKQPVFNLMRNRLGLRLGLITLIASFISNLITCAAEIGGVALVLQLLTGAPMRADGGRRHRRLHRHRLVHAVQVDRAKLRPARPVHAGVRRRPRRHPPALGRDRRRPRAAGSARTLQPRPDRLRLFRGRAAQRGDVPLRDLFLFVGRDRGRMGSQGPRNQPADHHRRLRRSARCSPSPFSPARRSCSGRPGSRPRWSERWRFRPGCRSARSGSCSRLLGMLFAIGGAAIETCLANAYSLGQFFGWRWGRHRPPREAPRFTLSWMAVFVVALIIVLTGVEPVELAEYAVVASILVLPLTYLPLLLLAGDRTYMRVHANGLLSKTLGWGFYALIVVAALAALPLFLLTSGGQL
jgi:hypothetical protein